MTMGKQLIGRLAAVVLAGGVIAFLVYVR